MNRILPLIATILLGACASKTDLVPPPGQSPPPAPFGRIAPPPAEELLEPPVQAVPERSIELRRRSEEREDDPFDLPPED